MPAVERVDIDQVVAPARRQLFIGGQWRDGRDTPEEVVNPSTGQPVAAVAGADVKDIDDAVLAARAQVDHGPWTKLSGPDRSRLLSGLADLIERDREIIAGLEALDVGKPITDVRNFDVPNAADCFRYYAGWADKLEGRTIPTRGYFGRTTHSYTVREPIGVVAAIVPWNGPTMISAWKLAPALAAGCTIVLKPSELAPLAVLHLASLVEEAGFPAGTVNVVPGQGAIAGRALVEHPHIDKVTFTGSTAVGREIAGAAGRAFKRVTLELGGKSPQIILADAHIDAAIAGCAYGLFKNAGQVCSAGTRILVHREIHDEFVNRLVEAAQAFRLGDAFDPATTMGPLISEEHLRRVMGHIERGVRDGGRLATGGERRASDGFFVNPTIFTGVDNDMAIAQEEIFGPVGVAMPFSDLDEAVALANTTRYGLSATVWTESITSALTIARNVKAGAVWINGWGAIDARLPWGGRGESGTGKDLGWASIEANTFEKVVTVVG